MKKIVIIENCEDCPYISKREIIGSSYYECTQLFEIVYLYKDIPENCPLETKED